MLRLVVRGPAGPAVFYRFEAPALTVGRAPENLLVLDDPRLSRLHAELRLSAAGWVVRDRGSQNGTELNGRPVPGEARLTPGDEIRVGSTVLVFEGAEAGAVAETAPEARATWSRRGESPPPVGELIGDSEAMRALRAQIDRVAPAASTVLLLGDNGTGKELAARLLHERSPRREQPFVVVNCPAVPDSLFESELFGVERGVASGVDARIGRIESAAGGTLVLDEVGDLGAAAQAKLLRFLADRTIDRLGARAPRKVDVRVIAATNHDLQAAIAAGRFRRDLYYRLAVVTIRLPSLAARREDIAMLTRHFLDRLGERRRLGQGALDRLADHAFPGNVRELKDMLEQAALLSTGETLEADAFPALGAAPATGAPAADGVDEILSRIVAGRESFWAVVSKPFLRRQLPADTVRELIDRTYRDCGGSYRDVARRFGIEAEHKRLLDFLNRHDLGVRRPAR